MRARTSAMAAPSPRAAIANSGATRSRSTDLSNLMKSKLHPSGRSVDSLAVIAYRDRCEDHQDPDGPQ